MSETTTPDIPTRVLGRTGERVSAIGLGGWHLYNSWDYNEGRSELRMGQALRDGYRDKVFRMTKIDGRSSSLAPSP